MVGVECIVLLVQQAKKKLYMVGYIDRAAPENFREMLADFSGRAFNEIGHRVPAMKNRPELRGENLLNGGLHQFIYCTTLPYSGRGNLAKFYIHECGQRESNPRLCIDHLTIPANFAIIAGGRARSDNLCFTKAPLCQLSYAGRVNFTVPEILGKSSSHRTTSTNLHR